MRLRFSPTIPILTLLMLAGIAVAQEKELHLKMEEVMTPQELNETGIATLTSSQRKALDAWLNRYTATVVKVMTARAGATADVPQTDTVRSSCVPAIESTISGDFEGRSGDTIFKLDNGQIWEQAEYEYMYSYQYRPDVTIYQTRAGCVMKVEDEDETIAVRRIK